MTLVKDFGHATLESVCFASLVQRVGQMPQGFTLRGRSPFPDRGLKATAYSPPAH